MFDCVLIANRGEIAVRIARTLRSLGIRSVAVFSDADRDSRHVHSADEAVHIGPAEARLSYLDVERVIDAVLRSGAQALHPGYGFLSENTALAAACADAGIVFVGPPVAAIEAMGDKIRAKATVAAHGVRVVPGVSGVGLTVDELVAAATSVGLPALIKPSAGGGGKGMRLVTDIDQFPEQIAAAQREARSAFGDDTLLIERFIERPRHIEVQVLADSFGNVVHVGERECSLQRRHQKVIEEAPSPFLNDTEREALGAQAVAAARSCGYVNAGTVEFIVSGSEADQAYFLEMNTRLQVEHPITEMVWGIDLVEQQLRIAAGLPLGFEQADLHPRGHAFEARVYAEDPAAGFLPTGGTVELLREADDLAFVRVDSSLRVGTRVASHYDPMLAKVIAWGEDRESARRRLDAALANTCLLGVTNNIAFLRTVLSHAHVVAGALDTGLVERIDATVTAAPEVAVAAALALLEHERRPGPWGERRGWRLGEPAMVESRLVDLNGHRVVVHLRALDGDWEATVDGRTWSASAELVGARLSLTLDGVARNYCVVVGGHTVWLGVGGSAWCLRRDVAVGGGGLSKGVTGGSVVVSPMPGTVVSVLVASGDAVVERQPLVVVEAMKMEHTLRASRPSIVSDVMVQAGDRVELRQVLVVLEPDAADNPEAPA